MLRSAGQRQDTTTEDHRAERRLGQRPDRCLYVAKQGDRNRWVGALQCAEAGLAVNADVVVEDFLGHHTSRDRQKALAP